MIFMHLPGELDKLRKTCQRFNKVITNSLPLMKRCQLIWNFKKEKHFRSSDRIFCNVKLNDYLSPNEVSSFLQFVRHHHRTLSKLECFVTSAWSAEAFHEFLSLLAEAIVDLKWQGPLERNVEKPRIILPKLKTLVLNHDAARFFDYTGTDTRVYMPLLREFEYIEEDEEPTEESRSAFMEFLRNSKHLEVLKVQNSLARRMITDSSAAPFTFPLKRLHLEITDYLVGGGMNEQVFDLLTPQLPKFLESLKNSLTQLTIKNAVLHSSDLHAILTLEIKQLEIINCRFVWEDEEDHHNFSIERFILRRQPTGSIDDHRQNAVDYLLQNSKGLQSIEYIDLKLCLPWTLAMSEMKSLTDLNLVRCSNLCSLHFPTLKRLTIDKSDDCHMFYRHPKQEIDEVSQLILLNQQLEKISVPFYFEHNNLFDWVSYDFEVEYH